MLKAYQDDCQTSSGNVSPGSCRLSKPLRPLEGIAQYRPSRLFLALNSASSEEAVGQTSKAAANAAGAQVLESACDFLFERHLPNRPPVCIY